MKELKKSFRTMVLPDLKKVISLYKQGKIGTRESLEAISSLGTSCQFCVLDINVEYFTTNNNTKEKQNGTTK